MKTPEGCALRAGAARVDLTTATPRGAIRDPLYAKSLVLDDGERQVALIAMDTTAISGRAISDGLLPDGGEEFLPALRGRIERELGISGQSVLVNATHTHPPGRLLCDDEEQVARTFDAVRRAFESRVPVKVGAGASFEDRITVNRTLREIAL